MPDEAGMKFQSGYWGFEEDSLEEATEWNQRKLEEDFNLGFTEHHSHDYKQVIYKFGGYSEVRGGGGVDEQLPRGRGVYP